MSGSTASTAESTTIPAGIPRQVSCLGGWRRGAAARLLLAALALLLAGCVTERQEQELGDTMAADVNSSVPLVRDELLNLYVNQLGQRIARVSERPDLNYRFYIINSATVNAFALPGGHVYLTRGLIERTRDGRELAGVLAHEIGHIAARHGVDKLQRHLRTGSLVGVLYQVILGGEPELLQRNAVQLGAVLWSASHSREDEREADRLAVEYLLKAGIEPDGIITLLETLLAEEQDYQLTPHTEWFSTHPLTQNRIEETRAEILEEREAIEPVDEVEVRAYPAFLRRVSMLPPPLDAALP